MKNMLEKEQQEALTLAVAGEAWRRGILEYKLDDLQKKIYKDITSNGSNKILILSSRQIGKSFFSCVYALMYLIQNPNKIARICAPTIEQAAMIVEDNLAYIIEDAPPGFIHRKKSALRWDLANGSSLRLGGLKRSNVDSNRGGNCSLAIFEESGFCSGPDFTYAVNSVIGPQLLRSAGKEIFISSPSEDPEHPLHTKVLPEAESCGSVFRYTVYDSPSLNEHQIEEAIRRSGGKNSEAFRREYMAEIIRSTSMSVVPFSFEKHVKEFPTPDKSTHNYSITIDWGGVRDKTVGLLTTYDFNTNKLICVDEMVYEPNTPTDTIVKGLRDLEEKYDLTVKYIYADCSGQTAVDLNNNHGIIIVSPAKNDWLASVNNMASEFHASNIVIHKRCDMLIKTCYSGMFAKNKKDFARSELLGHCDALAALMYAVRAQSKETPYQDVNYQYGKDDVFVPPQPEAETLRLVDYNPIFTKKKALFSRN
tara:strand:+ start:2104 stop:3540 length:1437 start_codon:yes stop_codon:yes gene_type:complete